MSLQWEEGEEKDDQTGVFVENLILNLFHNVLGARPAK